MPGHCCDLRRMHSSPQLTAFVRACGPRASPLSFLHPRHFDKHYSLGGPQLVRVLRPDEHPQEDTLRAEKCRRCTPRKLGRTFLFLSWIQQARRCAYLVILRNDSFP